MTITKNYFIKEVGKLGFDKKDSVLIVDRLLEIIKSTLDKGEDLLVSGFGKFCVKEKNERKGRNPATGKEMTLRKRRVVTFKYSGKLKDMINANQD